jgi:hypothetical protein
MPEECGLYPKMPVGEQLAYFGELHGADERSARTSAGLWMERLGVSERAGVSISAIDDPDATLARICTFVPPITPMVVPAGPPRTPCRRASWRLRSRCSCLRRHCCCGSRRASTSAPSLRCGAPLKLSQALRLASREAP